MTPFSGAEKLLLTGRSGEHGPLKFSFEDNVSLISCSVKIVFCFWSRTIKQEMSHHRKMDHPYRHREQHRNKTATQQ